MTNDCTAIIISCTRSPPLLGHILLFCRCYIKQSIQKNCEGDEEKEARYERLMLLGSPLTKVPLFCLLTFRRRRWWFFFMQKESPTTFSSQLPAWRNMRMPFGHFNFRLRSRVLQLWLLFPRRKLFCLSVASSSSEVTVSGKSRYGKGNFTFHIRTAFEGIKPL